MYRWYDCINGEWIGETTFSKDDAKAELLKESNDQHVIDEDHYMAHVENDDLIITLSDAQR